MGKARSAGMAGAVITELLVIIVVIISFCFAGIEFSRGMHKYTTLSTVTQQIAKGAVKDCDRTTSSSTPSLAGCLENHMQGVSRYLQEALPNTTAMISIYEVDPLDNRTVRRVAASTSSTVIPGADTHYTPERIRETAIDGSVYFRSLDASFRPRIVVSEVFTEYKAIVPVPFLSRVIPRVLYETAIY